jgi:hypothetical protein
MAINVFDLYAKIGLDSIDYDKGLEQASSKGSSFASKIGGAMKVAAGAITAVTTAVAGASAAFIKATNEAAAYGDNIDKMSQKMGLTAEAYQEWDAVLQHSGTSIESLQTSMKTLASAAETGNEAFQQLGITQEEIAKMSQQDLFEKTITALQDVEDTTQRTYLAGKLLGRGATELGALLNTSAEETQAMRDRVHELGGVMSDEAVKAAAKYQDTLQDMTTAFNGLKRNIVGEFIPGVTTAMDGLTELFAGNNDKGIALINTGIEQFSDKFTEILPTVLNTGTKIVQGLGDAITKNAPALVKTGSDAIIMLANGAIDRLPDIVKMGGNIIVTLSKSIKDSLPDLIPAARMAITEVADIITDPETVMTLLDAGLDIVVAIGEGIVDGLVELDDRVPEIIDRVGEVIERGVPAIMGAGAKILHAIADGFAEEYPQFSAVVGGAADIVDEGIIPAFQGVLDFLRGDFDSGLIEISHGIEGTVSSSLGIIDGLLDTHLQQWYDKTATFFEGFGRYLYDTFNEGAGDAKLSYADAMARWADVDMGEPFDQAKADFDAMIAKGEEYKKHYTQTVHAIKLLSDDTNNEIQQENEILQDELEEKAEIIEANTKEIEKQQKEAEKQAEKRRKAEEKAANELLKAQQKAEQQMTKNLEAAISQREKLYSEYEKNVKSIYDKIDDMQENYKITLANRTKEIYSSFTLFEEVPERLQVSGQDLMKNLENQLDRMTLFYSELDQLQAKGVSQGLVDEIRSMGVGQLDNLDALLDMSDEEIRKYSSLYDKKVSFADAQAKAELEASKNDTLAAIEDEYAEIDKLTAENAKNTGLTFVEKLGEGIKEGFEGSTVAEMATFGLFGAYAGMSGADYMQTNYGQTEVKTRNTVSAGLAPITININGIQFQNMSELAETLGVEINKQVRRENAAYA